MAYNPHCKRQGMPRYIGDPAWNAQIRLALLTGLSGKSRSCIRKLLKRRLQRLKIKTQMMIDLLTTISPRAIFETLSCSVYHSHYSLPR